MVLFRFGGEYAPRAKGIVLGLRIFDTSPQQNAGGGRSWLIHECFVMF